MSSLLDTYRKRLIKRMLHTGLLSSQPTVLSIFTTNRCNFSCFYCSRNILDESPDAEYRYDDKSEFHMEELEKILDKYPAIRKVSFVGIGEPFLIKDLIPMAMLAHETGRRTTVISNGSLIHRQWGNIGPNFDDISISLHGLNAVELQNIAKVKENIFNQFVENIRYLVNVEAKEFPNLNVHASVVFLKQNLERVSLAAKFCMENGIPVLDLHNYLSLGPDARHNVVFEDEHEYIDFTEKLIEECKGRLKINPPVWIKRDETEMEWGCISFYHYLRVDGLGQVSGCGRIMPPEAENGNFGSEEDVFQNEYFKSMRASFRTGKGIPACCRYCPDAQ
ncbi:MAG: radical SAM protein [Anaerolineales bacterium]|nr:radical SAM protein [Anaerolineales bacterium]